MPKPKTRILGLALILLVPALAAQFSVSPLTRLGDYESRRTSSYDRTGGNADYRRLPAGETLEIFSEAGPAEIRHVWITMAAGEAYHLKKVVLRMYWDGEADPSVETPIGDFFGLGLGTYTVFHAAPVFVAPDKALNTYFPMPFARRGRITVTNEGREEITDVYWNIDWVKLPAIPPDTAYFHAQYRQAAPFHGWYKGNFYGNDFSEARRDPRWLNTTAGTTTSSSKRRARASSSA